jgi:hypothetical protein
LDRATGSAPGMHLDERLVARLWDDQHPFTFPFRTAAGEEIHVVYRGRRRYDRGPDFPGALIAMPGEVLRLGDVEVHVHASDWRRHGHDRDPYYNGVVLHVVLWDDSGTCLRQDGALVPVLELASHLSRPLESVLSHDYDDIPHQSPCWRGSLEPGGELGRLLERCGTERFEARVSHFEANLTCYRSDQLLYRSIAVALGYSQNRQPFEKLAETVPLEMALAYLRTRTRGDGETGGVGDGETGRQDVRLGLEALLMGAAGLLPSQRGLPCEGGDCAEPLEASWAADGAAWAGASLQPAEWQFFRVRPNNFPTRRVAALAQLLSRWPADGLAQTLIAMAASVEPRRLPRALEALLLGAPRDGYWALHSDFGQSLRRPADLIGRQRAAEIAVNVFLPFLAASAAMPSGEDLGKRAREAYPLYPKRGDNELSRYVAAQITGTRRPAVARSACRQQGLLHIYRTWCEVKRCAECPCGLVGS